MQTTHPLSQSTLGYNGGDELAHQANVIQDPGGGTQRWRARASKACDRCHFSRVKCDTGQPCGRCSNASTICTYNRASRRRGRLPRKSLFATDMPSQRLNILTHNNSFLDRAASGVEVLQEDLDLLPPDAVQIGHVHGVDSDQAQTEAATNSEDQGHGIPISWEPSLTAIQQPVSSLFFPDELVDVWSGSPIIVDSQLDQHGNPRLPRTVPEEPPDHDDLAFAHRPPPQSSILPPVGQPSEQRPCAERPPSSLPIKRRYAVLEPLYPYLDQEVSPELACDLLDSYFADKSEGSCIPASPLLLCHIFRRSSFASSTQGRPSSLALLSSLLLVAAATTESPFFGASPTARARLLRSLFTLTLSFLHDPQHLVSRTTEAHSDHIATKKSDSGDRYESRSSVTMSSGRHRFVDEVVTYMHLALVSMTTEVGSFATRWWHTAFQLAKEYRLNADVMSHGPSQQVQERPSPNGESPSVPSTGSVVYADSPFKSPDVNGTEETSIAVRDNKVIDGSDYRFVSATREGLEESRRVWWSLYIWDKQLALSHNVPASITNLECQEVSMPMSELAWQGVSTTGHSNVPQFGGHPPSSLHSNPPSDIFGFFVPFSMALETLLDHRQSLMRRRLAGRMGYQPLDSEITAGDDFRVQLERLAQDFDIPTSGNAQNNADERFSYAACSLKTEIFPAYARLLIRILFLLDSAPWDMTDAVEGVDRDALLNTATHQTMSISVVRASEALRDVFSLESEFSFNPLYCDVFLFLGSAIAYMTLSLSSQDLDSSLGAAGETFVRALESVISAAPAEHQVCLSAKSWALDTMQLQD
ncbi:Arabinanolytic transcriptional activator araR [Penicillium subrubescens]|uniref:Xylanolytic transcriptional activator xlnR n=1 Tax=Penicillium subrubescens TaxID=1316194 RepID=A0A1Q5UDQ4_9EURO|nr:Arabinanolytic transcriptional activator araR [Penicillium subrubescens]